MFVWNETTSVATAVFFTLVAGFVTFLVWKKNK